MANRDMVAGSFWMVSWSGGQEVFADRPEAWARWFDLLADGEDATLEPVKRRKQWSVSRRNARQAQKARDAERAKGPIKRGKWGT